MILFDVRKMNAHMGIASIYPSAVFHPAYLKSGIIRRILITPDISVNLLETTPGVYLLISYDQL
jgi:hypothetical protein